MKKLRNLKPPRVLYILLVIFFVAKMVVFIIDDGNQPLGAADSTAESNSIVGARNMARDGFFASSGLPDYGQPFNLDSPSEKILNSNYYAHYFPGPDYVMALSFKLFGDTIPVLQWTRLIPLLSVLLAALFFFWAAERSAWRGDPWVAPCLALFVLLPPGMRPWAISLHGHAYTSSYILAGLGLGLCASEWRLRKYLMPVAFMLGFLSNYMLLTAAAAVFTAPIAGGLLAVRDSDKGFTHYRRAILLSLMVGVGLLAAFAMHFLQVAHQFGSHDAFIDLFGTIANRSAKVKAGEPSHVQMLGIYSHHAYTFWGLSAQAMALLGLFLGWLSVGSRAQRASLAAAVIVAGLGSYAWVMGMKNHAWGHWHVDPRIFYLMWTTFLAALGATAAAQRAVRAQTLRFGKHGEADA